MVLYHKKHYLSIARKSGGSAPHWFLRALGCRKLCAEETSLDRFCRIKALINAPLRCPKFSGGPQWRRPKFRPRQPLTPRFICQRAALRRRDPRPAPRVVERAALAARVTKTALAEAKAVFVAGAVGIEPTTRGFGVDVEHQGTV